MRESLGNTFVFNIVIVFISIIIVLLVGSLSYTKTFKVKNQIIDIIEKYNGYNAAAKEEIEFLLSRMGYKVNAHGRQKCNASDKSVVLNDYASNYRYCVVQYSSERGNYYGVTAYMYFEIPLINSLLEFPIYGETKVIYEMIY